MSFLLALLLAQQDPPPPNPTVSEVRQSSELDGLRREARASLREAQDPYTITGEGRVEDATTIGFAGKTNLPEGAVVAVALWYGEAGTGRSLGAPTLVSVKNGAFTVSFKPFKDKNLPGAYAFDIVFATTNQQGEVRKKMGSRFREVRATVPYSIGTAAELEKSVDERRRALAAIVETMSTIQREAEEHFRHHVLSRDQAHWAERQAGWIQRIDEALGGLDRHENMLVPDGFRITGLLGGLHEELEEHLQGLGRVLANAKKQETYITVIAASLKLSEKFRYVRVLAGVEKGTSEDLAAAVRGTMSAMEAAVKAKGSEESRRAFHAAALSVAALASRPAQKALADGVAKALEAIDRAAQGGEPEMPAAEAVLLLSEVLPLSRKWLPR